jgi:RNA polymerase sigma-70 factor (ECF subfamily)
MDLLQDTMLKAFTDIRSFRGDCTLKAWLCTIGRNLYLDHLKKAENRNLPLEEAAAAAEQGFAEMLEQHDTAMQIHRLLHRLDEPYREIFSLRIFAELSFAEIGSIFGKSESWARVTFFRAKKKLIAWMNEEDAS